MKKLILVLLCFALLVSMIACSNTANDSKDSNPAGNDRETKSQADNHGNPNNPDDPHDPDNPGSDPQGAELNFKYENIDMNSVLEPLKLKELNTPYENSTVKMLVSPFEFDEENVLSGLKGTALCKDLTFYHKESEMGDSVYFKNYGDVWTKYKWLHYLVGCPAEASDIYDSAVTIYVSYTPSQTLGVSTVECEFDDVEINDAQEFQQKAEETLAVLLGKDIAHAIVYDKCEEPNDKSGIESYSYAENVTYEDGDATNKYMIVREAIDGDDGKYIVRYAIYLSSTNYNYFENYHEEYTPAISQMPISTLDIFKFDAGVVDVNTPTTSLIPYMSIGGEEAYIATVLNKYEYNSKEHPSGITEYNINMEWSKNADVSQASMTINLKTKLDRVADNEAVAIDLSLNGYPDQVFTDDWQTVYPKLLPEVKEQLKLVFGSGIDVSDLSLDMFETTGTDTNGVEIKEYSTTATLTILGKPLTGTVTIKLSDTAVDTLRAMWSFSAVLNP